MKRLLWHKNRLLRDSKGFSSILGSVFVLMILLLSSFVLITILNQNTSFQVGVREVNQMDIERSNEKVTFTNPDYAVISDQIHVTGHIKNEGTDLVQIITLWVEDTTIQQYNYNDTINIYVKSGDTVNFTESNPLIVTLQGADSSDVFNAWFVTARGNQISPEEEIAVTTTQEAPPPVSAFGVFSLDWFQFNYSSLQSPVPSVAGSISKTEDYISFYVRVTNNYNETATLKEPTMLMLLIDYQEPLFYLVENVSYPIEYWTTDWSRTTYQKHTGSYSIQANEYDTTLTSIDLDSSDAMNVTVSFWYRDDDIDDYDDVYLQFWDGSSYDNIFELGNTYPEDIWTYYTFTTSDPQYLIPDFHIRIVANSIDSGENLWVDDVSIIKSTASGDIQLLSDGFETEGGNPVITAYEDADPITVDPGETVSLVFASESSGVTSWRWGSTLPLGIQNGATPEGAIAMVALVFTLESDPTQMQAQSLPFRALVLD